MIMGNNITEQFYKNEKVKTQIDFPWALRPTLVTKSRQAFTLLIGLTC